MLCYVPYIIICCIALQFLQSHCPPCLASCYITLSNLALTRAFQTPPSQTFPLTTNPALHTHPCCYQTPSASGFQGGEQQTHHSSCHGSNKEKTGWQGIAVHPWHCFSPICCASGPNACWSHSPTLSTSKNWCFWFIWTCQQSKCKVRHKGCLTVVCASLLSALQGASIACHRCHSWLVFWQRFGCSSMSIGHPTSVWWGKQVVGTQEVQSFQKVGFFPMDPRQLGKNRARSNQEQMLFAIHCNLQSFNLFSGLEWTMWVRKKGTEALQ